MTDHSSSDRDELVAAYLDGEASEAERALVEADPDLMERARLMREVADMVAEPVMPPEPSIRRAHIEAALAISSTAPNVTSLATRRRGIDIAKVASIAAVVIAIFAVPIVLSRGGGDGDETAATVVSADEGTVQGGDGSTASDLFEPADSSAAAELEAPAAAADDDAADDGAAFDEAASEPEAEPAPAEEALNDSDLGVVGSLFSQRFDVELAADLESLGAQVLQTLDQAEDRSGLVEPDLADLNCTADLLDIAGSTGEGPALLVGTALLGAQPVEYVVSEDAAGLSMSVLDTACAVLFSGPIDGAP